MATVQTITGDVIINGAFRCTTFTAPTTQPTGVWGRASLIQDDLQEFLVPLSQARVHDAPQTVLPATSANDDLGITTVHTSGTFTWARTS